MALWIEDLVQKNQYSRPALKLLGVKGIVMHWTATPGATDENEQNFFDGSDGGGGRYASAHIFADRDSARLIIPLNEVAYHANEKTCKVSKLAATASYYRGGGANLTTIGIEMCVEKDSTIHSDTVERCVDIAAYLCEKYNLNPMDDIYRHHDITGKNCPAPWVSDSSKFTAFKKSVKAKMNGEKVVETVKTEVKATAATSKTTESTSASYKGKRVESIYKGSEGLNFYSKASWDKKYKVGNVGYGIGFPTIVDKVKVDGAYMYKVKNSKGDIYYITASSDYVKVEGETAKTTTTKKVKKKYVVLPKTDSSWRVYPTNKTPVAGNEKGFLNPKKFGGLEYQILGNPQTDVYTIKTGDFGKVNIYAAKSTGAKIVTK